MRIIVAGYIVRGPLGGLVWHHLQYVIGLRRLGHDVYFIEDSDDYPGCYNPETYATGVDAGYGLEFARRVFARHGLADRWAYHDAHASRWEGPRAADAEALCRSADLLLNLSGMNPLRPWLADIPVRALVDTDPAFTQIRHLTDPEARAQAARHTHFLSFGENIGQADCSVPDDGLPWRATRQPVVMDLWPVAPPCDAGAFTTVMQWDSYHARDYGGRRYGMKSASFDGYFDLPSRTGERLELAIGSPSAPREELLRCGWHVRDSLDVTRDPADYQRYLRESKAELTVAKHGYVISRSGWFSERSACYLATGRPVVAQDTGSSRWLDTGAGIMAFTSPGEALAAIDDVATNYRRHCRDAAEIARCYFDSDAVLSRLLEAVSAPGAVAGR